ncbi:MAG: DUF4337 family protein [Candidatus Eremiobacteraeota bacterium]|nr:DUF4337 family protein [Candidatus Eremiobacteraeota bacterium]MBV9646526.1 DUF4337 family protein [Candidatus Eremiobacteraeota bacterium]
MSDFHAGKALDEAHERHELAEHAGHAVPRWIPVAAAVLALLAASSGLVANMRVTQSSAKKSDAIILITRAADIYQEYNSRSIRQHIYEAAEEVTTDRKHASHLRTVAEHEKREKGPLLVEARTLDRESREATESAEHILISHEILEVATTLFEIAIVLVSVTALVGTRVLPGAAAAATILGLAIALRGLFY